MEVQPKFRGQTKKADIVGIDMEYEWASHDFTSIISGYRQGSFFLKIISVHD